MAIRSWERFRGVARRASLALAGVGMGAGLAAGAARGAEPVVTLDGWAGQGSLLAGNGHGGDLVRLIAEARWAPGASRNPLDYLIRATFPDGHAETRAFPNEEPPGRSRFVVYLPAGAVRNLNPDGVHVEIAVVDAATGSILSNPLDATIAAFPRLHGTVEPVNSRPLGWGQPLDLANGAATSLPNPSPDGFRFVRVPGDGPDAPPFFLARTEATVAEVAARLPGYDPRAGRSDEFALEGSDQPAVGLTPARALEYLKALTAADEAGVAYRLPTVAEWTRAARGGKATAFWWGDEPTYPAGANLLGAEPALPTDTTAPSLPSDEADARFLANPFGLYHSYGNVAEWAGAADGGFARLGGSFRTEPASPLPDVAVAKDDDLGPDPFVGVRPALTLTSPAVEAIARRHLEADPKLANVRASYDPARSTITLTGRAEDAPTARAAAERLRNLWFLAAVVNQVDFPRPFPGQLATLAPLDEPARVEAVLDRSFVDVPVGVRWFEPLPVIGSEWFANIYLPNGEHLSHKLTETEAGRFPRTIVSVDRSRLKVDGLADGTPFGVAISLGLPAPTPGDPHVVSNVVQIRPIIRPRPLR